MKQNNNEMCEVEKIITDNIGKLIKYGVTKGIENKLQEGYCKEDFLEGKLEVTLNVSEIINVLEKELIRIVNINDSDIQEKVVKIILNKMFDTKVKIQTNNSTLYLMAISGYEYSYTQNIISIMFYGGFVREATNKGVKVISFIDNKQYSSTTSNYTNVLINKLLLPLENDKMKHKVIEDTDDFISSQIHCNKDILKATEEKYKKVDLIGQMMRLKLSNYGYEKLRMFEIALEHAKDNVVILDTGSQGKIKIEYKTSSEGLKTLFGIEKAKYERYTDFKKRILLPVIESINKTNCKVELEEIKLDRRVTGINLVFEVEPFIKIQ